MDVQDWTETSYDEARLILRKWREEHARHSEEIVEIWEHVLSRYASELKDELWAILEQVTIAALDSARQDLAIECLQRLTKQFPRSQRVTKLQAMRLESLGNYENAVYLYDQLLEADETNALFRKRKIAILVASGQRQEAIVQLNEYLDTFINDNEAWLQLSELFLQEDDFSRATFCFEELLLTNPNNVTYLCHIGDLRYSQGGAENIEIAKTYYEKSANLAPSANALYGLILCCNQLLNKASGSRKKELVACGCSASDQLIALYEQKLETQGRSQFQNPDLNPTIQRQIQVIRRLKNCFRE